MAESASVNLFKYKYDVDMDIDTTRQTQTRHTQECTHVYTGRGLTRVIMPPCPLLTRHTASRAAPATGRPASHDARTLTRHPAPPGAALGFSVYSDGRKLSLRTGSTGGTGGQGVQPEHICAGYLLAAGGSLGR